MPYIPPSERGTVTIPNMKNAGHLNYVITKIIIGYMRTHGLKYQTINDIVGALDGAKHEFQRRIVGPYEDNKILQNTDVYPQEGEYL